MNIPQEYLITLPLAVQEKILQAKDPESVARIIGPAQPDPYPKRVPAFPSSPRRSAAPPKPAKPAASAPIYLPIPKDCSFGNRQQKLCRILDYARRRRSDRREVERWELVRQVWGDQAASGRPKLMLVRLRGLCAAVNGKLQKAGTPLRIYSMRDGWLILQDRIANPPPPKNKRLRLPQEHPQRTARPRMARSSRRRRGLSCQECVRLLQEFVARGINRSSDLDRLFLKERGCSRRTYAKARRHLGLKARKTSMTGGWVIESMPSAPSERADEAQDLTGGET